MEADWKEITGLASNLGWYDYLCRGKLMAFPLAINQAKERKDPSDREKPAVAAELLLRILNDLALVPSCPNEERLYQTPMSDCFQVFAFTSEDPSGTFTSASGPKGPYRQLSEQTNPHL